MHHRQPTIAPGARAACAAGVLLVAAGTPALAQEAMYTEAATMPSPGISLVREQIHYSQYGANPNDGSTKTTQLEFMTTWQYGLAPELSFRVDVPVVFEKHDEADGSTDKDKGVEDIDLMLKWRIYRDDSGGVDTTRIALLGGAGVASGDDHDFSSQSVNPMIGAVFTKVWGRLGFNQDVGYRFNYGGIRESNLGGEGPDNAFTHNTALVYRIIPDAYTSDSEGAWYLTGEINGIYETNGDYELRWSPGLMYEGRRFGFEIMGQLPLYDDVHERPELDFRIGIGFRILF